MASARVRNMLKRSIVKSGKALDSPRLVKMLGLTRLDEAGTSPSKFKLPPAGVEITNVLGPAPSSRIQPESFKLFPLVSGIKCRRFDEQTGSHEIDIALYAMGVSGTKVSDGSGGKFAYPWHASETAGIRYRRFNDTKAFICFGAWPQELDAALGTTEGTWPFIGNNFATLVVNRVPGKSNSWTRE